MLFTILNITIRTINLIMGLVGLFLIVRVVLHLFNMPSTNSVMKVVAWPTDPLLNWLNKTLNLHTYTYRLSTSVDTNLISSLVALILLWGVRTVIMWLFNIVQTILVAFTGGAGGWLSLFILLIQILFNAYELALFVRIILDWLRVPQTNAFIRFLHTITEPLLAQIRRLAPVVVGGFDFSPIVAVFLIHLLRMIALSIVRWMFG